MLKRVFAFISDKQDEPQIVDTSAKPLDNIKVAQLIKKLTYTTTEVVIMLHDNITSINADDLATLSSSVYNNDAKVALIKMFIHKTVNFTGDFFVKIARNMDSDTTLKVFVEYKNLFTQLECFNAAEIAKLFLRKTVRNMFCTAYGLPIEPIEDRGEGFEVYGTFVPRSSLKKDVMVEFGSESSPYHVQLTLLKENCIRVSHSIYHKSGHSSSITTGNYKGVWIIDSNFMHEE